MHRKKPFTVCEHIHNRGRPDDLTPYGLVPIELCYNTKTKEAVQASVKSKYEKTGGPVVFDIEKTNRNDHNVSSRHLKEVVNWAHEAVPGCKVGQYAVGPSNLTPLSRRVEKVVDAFFPSMYVHNTNRRAWGLRTVEDARIQNPANPRWLVTALWEEDYLLWSLHHLTELGWGDAAKPRDFLLRLRVGLLTHAPDFDPRLAAPYRLVVGEKGPDGKQVVYDDWKKLGSENAKLSKPGIPDCGCCYGYSARAALVCGVDAGFPGAGDALAVLAGLLLGHREVLAREPYWAIAPRRPGY